MKKSLAVVLTVGALALSACSTAQKTSQETTSTATSSSSSQTSTSSTSSTSSTEEPETAIQESVPRDPQPAASPAPPVAEPPQQVESIFSETGVGYQCMATDAWVDDPAHCTAQNLGGDPSYDEIWGPAAAIPAEEALRPRETTSYYFDDDHCAAAICGYGTNSQGQPNPTSGELQTLHGCQEGYIDDPELCAAVAWVEHHEY